MPPTPTDREPASIPPDEDDLPLAGPVSSTLRAVLMVLTAVMAAVHLAFLIVHLRAFGWHVGDYVAARPWNAGCGLLFTILYAVVAAWSHYVPSEDEKGSLPGAQPHRLFHQLRVAYQIEAIILALGLLLIAEKHFLQNKSPEPIPEICFELGLAFFVAAVVSIMYEVQHRDEAFVRPVNKIGREIKKLEGLSNTLTDSVNDANRMSAVLNDSVLEANRISAYLNYRKAIQLAYSTARHRIISVSDLWITDSDWWISGDFLTAPLYTNLRDCLGKIPKSDRSQVRITFAGDVPWPSVSEDGSRCCFSPSDFERFLGVVWRLVICHKLRSEFGLQRADSIRVVTASAPVPATVVDNKVFIFLQNPRAKDEIEGSRGTQIAEDDPDTADAYEAMIKGYLRHVRSAREYVQSILYEACLLDTGLSHLAPISVLQNGKMVITDHRPLTACLEQLGLTDWLHSKQLTNSPAGAELYRSRAVEIIELFWQTNGIAATSLGSLRKDLL